MAGDSGANFQVDRTKLDATIDGFSTIVVNDLVKLQLLFDASLNGHQLVTLANQSKKHVQESVGPDLGLLGSGAAGSDAVLELHASTGEVALQQIRDILVPPHMSHIDDVTMLEDETLAVPVTIFDFETAFEDVILTVESSNASLIDSDSIEVVTGSLSDQRFITLTPVDNASGESRLTVTVTVTVTDEDGFSLRQVVLVTVQEVNDPPVFSVIGGDVVVSNDEAYGQAWATGISSGTVEEDALGQTVDFEVTLSGDDESLFLQVPSIDSETGVLSFTPDPNRTGVAQVTVRLTDDGGLLNDGENVSGLVTLSIVIGDPSTLIETLIFDVLPNPRDESVDLMTIVFSQPVIGFGLGDLILQRDGGENLLDDDQVSLTSINGQLWSLRGLSSLTESEGTYSLSLDAANGTIEGLSTSQSVESAIEIWDRIEIDAYSRYDVNRDHRVSGLDALAVINLLGQSFSIDVDRHEAYDVSRDGRVTPLDALWLINQLARMEWLSGAEGEGTLTEVSVDAALTSAAQEVPSLPSGASTVWHESAPLERLENEFLDAVVGTSAWPAEGIRRVDQAVASVSERWARDSQPSSVGVSLNALTDELLADWERLDEEAC